jgi:hypothetical protein
MTDIAGTTIDTPQVSQQLATGTENTDDKVLLDSIMNAPASAENAGNNEPTPDITWEETGLDFNDPEDLEYKQLAEKHNVSKAFVKEMIEKAKQVGEKIEKDASEQFNKFVAENGGQEKITLELQPILQRLGPKDGSERKFFANMLHKHPKETVALAKMLVGKGGVGSNFSIQNSPAQSEDLLKELKIAERDNNQDRIKEIINRSKI